jgi:hypothetical protein
MKTAKHIILSLFCVTLIGCATRTTTSGSDFDTSKVANITKGVTTSDELQNLLGKPYNKSVKSADEVVWLYDWAKVTATTSMGWSSPNIVADGYEKKLEVLIKNGVVVNYVLDEGPFHQENKEGSK